MCFVQVTHFLIVFFVCFAHIKSTILNETVIITTKNGLIRGRVATTQTAENQRFYAFQGIPYAEPPTGYLRFRSPKCVKNWSKIYNATSEQSMCLQSSNNTVVGSENCLFLNIYTPQLPQNNSGEPCATIVYIHGGGFIFGSGNLGINGADYFINNGIIFVTINYRLGVFGFLSTQDTSASGNWGLKDQILALQWIQKNIIYFGGDPKNVTIMGESAGAASVNFLVQSDRAKGLFKGAIAESGTTLNPWSNSRNSRQLAFRIGLANLIITFSSKDLVEGLRRINATQLLKSTGLPTIINLLDPLNGLPFAPVLESDQISDAVFTRNSYEARKNGQFNRVPFLNGFNSLEARIADKLPWYGILLIQQYNFDSAKLTPKDMNASNQGNRIVGNNIKEYYFKDKPITDNIRLINYISDDEFVRGIVKTSVFHGKYANCYLYEFSFIGSAAHQSFQPEGVSHAEELDFLFENPNWRQNTTLARLTVKRMVTMWSNFAKFGNPTPHLTATLNVTWPLVNATGNCNETHYLDINDVLIAKINPHRQQLTLWDKWYNEYGYQPYNTY